MRTFAFAGAVTDPEIVGNEERIVLSAGFDDPEQALADESQFHWAVLILCVSDDATTAANAVRDDLKVVTLEQLTDEGTLLTRPFRRLASQLQPRSCFVHPYAVGFKKDCPEAWRSATRVIRMAALRRRWQFWK
jgi:hypothetical protein